MSKAADPKRNSAYDDFSDSDEDDASSNGGTSGVTLGFADGNLANSPESSSTDKIGGLPSFWPVFENSVPDVAAAQCRECQAAMPLLAQINAPLDPEQCQDGALLEEEDRSRVLFLFGCIQKCCLSKPNSVRAFRAVRRHPPKPKKEVKPAVNPFAIDSSGAGGNSGPFDLGNAIFGSGDAAPHGTTDLGSDAESEDEGPPPATNRWAFTDQPKLPSQYIATEPEPASSSSDGENVRAFAEATKSLSLGEEAKTAVGGGGGAKTSRRSSGGSSAKPSSDNWSGEAYERQQLPIGVDEVFLKFEERLMRNKGDVASQIIRYHRASGQPLPYTADGEAFKALWKPVSNDHEGAKRTYDESGLPTCEGCGSGRTFELQLMPQLVSILSSTGLLRKKEDTFGLGWASAWVFTCQRDCGLSQDVATTGETWQEETVWLQFEEDSEAMKEAQRKLEQQNQKK